MDAKTRALFREIMREIGAKGGKIRQPGDHDAGGAVGAGEEGGYGCREEADRPYA
jgi:hypothetical protein